MRREAMEYLVGKQFCGKPIDDKLICRRPPKHRGVHSPKMSRRPLTPLERAERDVAKLKAARDSHQRRIDTLIRRVHDLEHRREWVEGYLGFRVEYRLRGIYRRLRRYYRFTRSRLA